MLPGFVALVYQLVMAGSVVRKIRVFVIGLALSLASVGMNACTRTPQVPVQSTAVVPDVVFVPTPFRVVDLMLDVAHVRAGDVLFDLGSGDGRIVIAAAKRFGIKATGIDIDPIRIRESHRNADTAGVAQLVDFREADLFTTDLRSATVVTLYLLPALNVRLRPKLFAELRPGSRVVSHSFDMGDWKADSTLAMDARIVYFWVMPADVSGRWTVTASDSARATQHPIAITQKYQNITMTARAGTAVKSAFIRGDRITFMLGDVIFEGRVTGDSMDGSATGPGGQIRAWSAQRERPVH